MKETEHNSSVLQTRFMDPRIFCLAYKGLMAFPSRSFKIQLQQAGLGRKKICFNSKANATEVKTKLEESYPKLIAGGGLEILRRGLSPSE